MKKSCLVCGNKEIKDLTGYRLYNFCRVCRCAWLKKIPKNHYQASYYQGRSGLAYKVFAPLEKLLHKSRIQYAGNYGNKLWMDIGAGDGKFLRLVNARQKIGVEVSESGRKIMEEAGLKTLAPNQFLKSKPLSASVISFWHVLEHMENPVLFLSKAEKMLDGKGVVVVGVPNIDSLEFKFFRQYWFHLVPQYHFWHFSPMAIKKILKKSGLEIKEIDYWSFEHHFTGVLQSFINLSSGSENFLHGLVKRGADLKVVSKRNLLWSLFWVSLGLPIVFIFWFLGSLLRQPGAFVVIAEKTSKR